MTEADRKCPHVATVGHHVWMQRGSGAVCCGGCYLDVYKHLEAMMNDDERLTPHETARELHEAMKLYMKTTGASAEQAVVHFNRVAEKLGSPVRVSLVDAVKD